MKLELLGAAYLAYRWLTKDAPPAGGSVAAGAPGRLPAGTGPNGYRGEGPSDAFSAARNVYEAGRDLYGSAQDAWSGLTEGDAPIEANPYNKSGTYAEYQQWVRWQHDHGLGTGEAKRPQP